jgi:hypothetical protein
MLVYLTIIFYMLFYICQYENIGRSYYNELNNQLNQLAVLFFEDHQVDKKDLYL